MVPADIAHALVYILFMIVGAVIFSIFWVQSAGMDARSQAKQMMASGLQIPGFRRDERVLERILDRYIWPLTINGRHSRRIHRRVSRSFRSIIPRNWNIIDCNDHISIV